MLVRFLLGRLTLTDCLTLLQRVCERDAVVVKGCFGVATPAVDVYTAERLDG